MDEEDRPRFTVVMLPEPPEEFVDFWLGILLAVAYGLLVGSGSKLERRYGLGPWSLLVAPVAQIDACLVISKARARGPPVGSSGTEGAGGDAGGPGG